MVPLVFGSVATAGPSSVGGVLASTGLVTLWLRAQVLGFLVKHSGKHQTPTTTWRSPRNLRVTAGSALEVARPGRLLEYRKSGLVCRGVVPCRAKF